MGIALRHGFQDWKPIYEHPENAALRRTRPHPHILHPGDDLFIPEREVKTRGASTGKTHVFKVKQPMRELCLTLRDASGKPLVNEPYSLEVGPDLIEGATDGAGMLQERIPLRMESVLLTVGERTYDLRLATLNPVEETRDQGISGVQARLRNLGFDPGPVDGMLNERTRQALCAFEVLQELPGEMAKADAAVESLQEEVDVLQAQLDAVPAKGKAALSPKARARLEARLPEAKKELEKARAKKQALDAEKAEREKTRGLDEATLRRRREFLRERAQSFQADFLRSCDLYGTCKVRFHYTLVERAGPELEEMKRQFKAPANKPWPGAFVMGQEQDAAGR